MQIFIHRVNTIDYLNQIPTKYGVEIDVRADGSKLILNHEPFEGGEALSVFLESYKHNGVIFNIKEAGIEQRVHELAAEYNITNYFLLDVEFPYLYRSARAGEKRIAIRYSEDESIETVLKYKGMVDWVWIDTNTQLPLNEEVIAQLAGFKTCLVCPERWGRPQDIPAYIAQIRALHFTPTAVMTALPYAEQYL